MSGRGRTDDRRGPRGRDDDRARLPQGPPIPEGITGRELPQEIRSQLRPLSKENAELVAKHLAAANELIGVDPEAAHAHAQTAAARGSRVAAVREAAGIIAYHLGQYAEALRELRTHRRISGSDDNLPLIADAERGRDRPQKALEIFAEASEDALGHDLYTELLMVAAGAHMDQGDVKKARALLETRNFAGNANGTLVRLLSVYSDVIRMQGDAELAGRYEELARRTAKATGTLFGDEDIDPNANVEIVTLEELELPEEAETEGEPGDDVVAAEHGEDAAAEADLVDAAAAEESDEGAAAATGGDTVVPSADEPAEAAAPNDEALRAVDREFDQEIVDELDEILADAEAADAAAPGAAASDAGGEPVPASDEPVPAGDEPAPAVDEPAPTDDAAEASAADSADESEPEPAVEGTTSADEAAADEAPADEAAGDETAAGGKSRADEDRDDDGRDDYEELTEPLFDL